MKRRLALIFCLGCFLFNFESSIAQDTPCTSTLDYAYVQANDPGMYQHFLDIDNFIAQFSSGSSANARLINPDGLIIIPVVVHVLHYGEAIGSGFNISQAQWKERV